MSKFLAAINAIKYGASLADPAIWKKRQNRFNAILGLLGAIVIFLPIEVSSEELAAIAGGIAAIAGVLNTYLTSATTDKIGIKPSSKSVDKGDGHGDGFPSP